MNQERIQKILSRAGFASRREIERWVEAGLIEINGVKATLGVQANEHDVIRVKGRVIENPLKTNIKTRVLLYNKPIGEISSRADPIFKDTVFDRLPHLKVGRWVQVGRLDLNTSGLLIFTNNGDLAQHLMHPKYELEREYAVRVHGRVTPEMLNSLLRGVELDDGIARFKRIDYRGGEGANAWYHVVLSEGRNREVRRLWESQGLEVSRLIRMRYGFLSLPRTLSRGEWVELSPKEVQALVAGLN